MYVLQALVRALAIVARMLEYVDLKTSPYVCIGLEEWHVARFLLASYALLLKNRAQYYMNLI